MSFRNNLQHLRATRNMTQEQLAMLCGVSRQAVTKWEAERSYPEMDKLLRLCEIFDCSLDELVSGDLTHRESDPALAVPAVGSPSDVTGYEAHWKRYAVAISAGVLVASLGVTCSCTLATAAEQGVLHVSDSVSALPLFIGGAIATCIFTPAGMDHMRFNRKHPFIDPFYTESEIASQQKNSIWQILIGVVIAVAGLCILVVSDQLVGSDTDWRTTGAAFLLWSIAASIMVVAGMRIYSLNINERNQKLECSGKVTPSGNAHGRTMSLNSAVCGIIMTIATIVALVWLFVAPGKGSLFWLPWVVGGCLCGAINIAFSVRRDE